MKYQQKTFQLPAAPPNITQERWNEIFKTKTPRKPKGK